MAQALLATSKLRVVFQVGVDEEMKAILKAKTFNNIQKDATADQLMQAAQAIINLSGDELRGVERVDSSDLIA